MNGPQHYEAAEGWLREVRYDQVTPQSAQAVAAAHVHATLAVAAATALGSLRVDDHGMSPADCNEWSRVAGVEA